MLNIMKGLIKHLLRKIEQSRTVKAKQGMHYEEEAGGLRLLTRAPH